MGIKEGAIFAEKIEKAEAMRKIGYWQTVGTLLLDNEELGKKWCSFVET